MAAGLRLLSWIFYNSNGACYSPFCPKLGTNLEMIGQVKWFKSYRYLKNSRWLPSCSHHLGFKKMNSAGNIPCGSEVGHQILKGSVEWFISYWDLKNPRWPPASGRHLGFW
jgi:hypothetical protein